MKGSSRFLIPLLFLFPGCGYLNPLIQDVNFVSIPQEIEVGAKMAEAVKAENQLSTRSADVNRVRGVGNRLLNSLPRRDFDYTFDVVEDASPNAFAIPGGHIYVHSGLLAFVDNDDQLAGVLAHEIGHVYERHPAKALSRAYGIQALTGLLLQDDATKWQELTLKVLQGGVLTKYGRDDEREADDIGYYLARRAGYSSHGLLDFLTKLLRIEPSSGGFPFFQSHPPTAERIERLVRLSQAGVTSSPQNLK